MSMDRHAVRVDADVWAAATARARAEGTTPSKLIRGWLADYGAGQLHATGAEVTVRVGGRRYHGLLHG